MSVTIELAGVSKSYDGVRCVVQDLNLKVKAREFCVLLGTSGCGKTTTLKLINRLEEPDAGEVRVGGRPVRGMKASELRRSIGYVVQSVGLFPHMTVGANVGLVPDLLGWTETAMRARVDELLELVHLPPDEYRERMPSELSGGQKQRVGFARALAAGPSVMLLDEPFSALDPMTRDKLQRDLRELHRRFELTIVMVTHDMSEAIMLADRVVVMSDGRVVQDGTPSELLRRPAAGIVRDLMEAPRRQAQAVDALLAGGP